MTGEREKTLLHITMKDQSQSTRAFQQKTIQRDERLIGRFTGGLPGPRVLVVAGLHGNEPLGVLACQKLLARLKQQSLPFYGELIAVRGNLAALKQQRRYLSQDLNRLWRSDVIAQLPGRMVQGDSPRDEFCELADLLDQLNSMQQNASTPTMVLDLHTTSSHSSPFVIVPGPLKIHTLLSGLPIPAVFGLEQAIRGTMVEYCLRHGIPALAFEGGQHQAPQSVDNLLAFLWLVLIALGAVNQDPKPFRAQLEQSARGLARRYRFAYRYRIQPDEQFTMKPGYVNFQRIQRGELLAFNRKGPILSPMDGYIFMPLYQKEGEDGFFIIQQEPQP